MARVSVVMPVFNGARFVGDALASLEQQTLRDIEIVVVDDGSSDGTWDILTAAAAQDVRVRLARHERNEGLRAALNRGLEMATAPLVARQDADDTAHPERLARQVAAFTADPRLILLGSAFEVVEEGRLPRVGRMPASDTAVRWRILFDNPLCHTSVMFRRVLPDAVPVRYESFRCEDYDLWANLLRYGRALNLPEPLVTRREHGDTYTIRAAGPQAEARADIAWREIKRVHSGTGLTRADVIRIHRWDDELPTILGPEDIRLCGEIGALLKVFGRRPEVDRWEAGAIARRWADRMLKALPDYRYRLAWREGLLPRLLALAPGCVCRDMIRRVAARGQRTDGGGRMTEGGCGEGRGQRTDEGMALAEARRAGWRKARPLRFWTTRRNSLPQSRQEEAARPTSNIQG